MVHQTDTRVSFIDQVRHLLAAPPDPTSSYFAITVFLLPNSKLSYSIHTHWVKYTDDKPRKEVRKASLVHSERWVQAIRETLGEPLMVVNSYADLQIFFQFGGNSLIEEKLAQRILPDWIGPREAVISGDGSFIFADTLPTTAFHKVPTPKQRMCVIKRDEYRCRICGRKPTDHLDLELHVHHIRPWGMGGVTEEFNLITLCQTCHKGLDPHFEHSLNDLLPKSENQIESEEFLFQLKRYQKEIFSEEENGSLRPQEPIPSID